MVRVDDEVEAHELVELGQVVAQAPREVGRVVQGRVLGAQLVGLGGGLWGRVSVYGGQLDVEVVGGGLVYMVGS